MRAGYDELIDETYNARKTGVSSDDLSAAVEGFLADIEELSRMDGPESLRLAYELMEDFRGFSYGDLDNGGSGEGDRPSDEPGDELLAELIGRWVAAGDVWDASKDLGVLNREAKYLDDYDIEPWYPKSRRLFREQAALRRARESEKVSSSLSSSSQR